MKPYDEEISSIEYDTAVMTQVYLLFSMLKPKIKREGKQWCVLYGDNLQEGIYGLGDTPYDAVIQFNAAWESQK